MRLQMCWTCLLAIMIAQVAAGFSSDTLIIVSRGEMMDTVTLADTLVMSFHIENKEAAPLYGFFLSDQVPSAFTLLESDVRISGTGVGDYVYERGYSDAIYQGNTPHRWAFETPPDFRQTNPIPQQSFADIEYRIVFSEAGEHVFRNFSWAGMLVRGSDTACVFGYDDDSLKVIVSEVGVDEDSLATQGLSLSLLPPCPNPFRESATISYQLPEQGEVSLSLYDGTGRLVARLFEGVQPEGHHSVHWENDADLPSGVYFVHLEAAECVTTGKIVLVK